MNIIILFFRKPNLIYLNDIQYFKFYRNKKFLSEFIMGLLNESIEMTNCIECE